MSLGPEGDHQSRSGAQNHDTPPKVSVLVLTYNHEKYIEQALESALSQEVDFEYEIVVGEDCSSDRTRDIVSECEQNHPERVRLLARPENVGMIRNFALTLEACRGQYVALLDGDDYWTSPAKLHRQAEYLDTHPDCAFCFHDWDWLYEDGRGRVAHNFRMGPKERYTLEDILHCCPTSSSTVMFRRGLFGELPSWVFGLGFADWVIHALNAQYGDGCYIDEVMSVYRQHSGQAWGGSSRIRQLEWDLEFYDAIRQHLGSRYKKTVTRLIVKHCLELKDLHLAAGNLSAARRYARRCVWEEPRQFSVGRVVRGFLHLYLRRQ